VTDPESDGDEEGGPRKSKPKRHSYRLRLLSPDRIEMQSGRYPAQQFVRCDAGQASATPARTKSDPALDSQASRQTAAVQPKATAIERAPLVVEPDKAFGAAGEWRVSTAKFGVGCVATLERGGERLISIGGETADRLSIVVAAERQLFDGDLDSESYVAGMEIVLGTVRKDGLRPYGYRGTAGVVAPFDATLKPAFAAAASLKLTERGSVKLRIPLDQTPVMMAGLSDCFAKTQ
jgi:hypothetical protein